MVLLGFILLHYFLQGFLKVILGWFGLVLKKIQLFIITDLIVFQIVAQMYNSLACSHICE